MPGIDDLLRERFARAIRASLGPELAGTDPAITTADPRFGDYQANLAMTLGKRLGRKPRELAGRIAAALEVEDICAEAPAVAGPGFINLRLSGPFLGHCLAGMLADPRLGAAPATPAETVVLDYSAPNVAKEMHVGHLRSTIIGDSLARVLGFLGHRVVRQNHIGDWGTQFGMLIEHLVDEGWDASRSHSVRDLNALYQESKRKFDAEPGFEERARRRVVALQGGDAATLALWRALIEESERHFADCYTRLGVLLTAGDIAPESFYNPRLAGVVEELEAKGLAVWSEGALCVFPEGFQDKEGRPLPFLIRKRDGAFLYATTDLAALRYRIQELGARRLVYVTDARQRQHFAMLFEVARLAGWTAGGVRLEHVPFGSVLGEDGRPFKTRSGETVRLSELLDEAVERAYGIVSEKNPDLPQEERRAVARAVGIGAVKYADLSSDRVKDYVFRWDRMLSLQGNTAPYLQYAWVRIRSIFRTGQARGIDTRFEGAPVVPDDPAERALGLKLLQYPGVLRSVSESLEPHRLCTWLYELASALHVFHETCPVLTAPGDSTRRSRLALSELVGRALGQGLGLLGIDVVERM